MPDQMTVDETHKISKPKPKSKSGPRQVTNKIKTEMRISHSSDLGDLCSNTNSIENEILNIDGVHNNLNPITDEVELFEENDVESYENVKDETCIILEIEPIENVEMSSDILESFIYEKISKHTLKMTEMFMINDEKYEGMTFTNMNEISDVDVAGFVSLT